MVFAFAYKWTVSDPERKKIEDYYSNLEKEDIVKEAKWNKKMADFTASLEKEVEEASLSEDDIKEKVAEFLAANK